MLRTRILSILILITVIIGIICPAITSVVIATETNTIKLNYTKYKFENLNSNIRLQATFTGETENITWKSDNENAVEVDQNGKVTSKSAGFSYIRVNGTTCSAKCMIYVATPVQLSDGSYGYVGDLDRNGVLDANDASLISEIYKTEKGDKEIADIDGNGVVDVNDSSLLMDIYRFYEFNVPSTTPSEQNNDDQNGQGEEPSNPTEELQQEVTYTNNLKETDLIRIYNSRTGFDITLNKDSTIDEVIAKYGQPKIKTESAFGGFAYTFYTDSQYSNYLYLETTLNDETIISYGTVWNEFFIYNCGYDENIYVQDNTPLQGFQITNGVNAKLKGGVYYNRHKLIGGDYTSTTKTFETNYKNNPVLYLKSMAKHAITMYNAICTMNGYTCNLQFNEDIFYINEQLKQNSSSIIEYAESLGKRPYKHEIGNRDNVQIIQSSMYYVLCPAIFANMYYSDPLNNINMPEKYKYGVFDYNIKSNVLNAYCITDDMFKTWDKVELTSEETTKLNNARDYYNTAMELFKNNSDSIYKNEPIDNSAENLYAGELKDTMKQAGIAYYNAIRAGQGLSTVVQNETGRKQAQAMAVLQSYRWHQLGLGITHSPEKPTGVTDNFYKTATGYGQVSLAENISMSNNMKPSTYAIQRYIRQFMDDSSETPFRLGHRTSLLIPSNFNLGYGVAKSIGVMEIGHSSNLGKDIDMVAWPSKGITFLETLETGYFRWSAKFYNNYEVTTDTKVNVKCIQNGETWSFNKQKEEIYNYYKLNRNNVEQELQNLVIFGNETLIPQPGFVYEITISNIKDKRDNSMTSYTYRSVFEYADTSKYDVASTNVSIVNKNLSSVSGENKTYYIPVGEPIDLDVTLNDNLLDKKITWSTSNNNITLTQNGTVYLDKKVNEKIAITVTHDSTKATDTIYLKTFDPNQVKLSESNLNIIKNETKNLSISELAAEIGQVNNIEWYVIKNSNPSTEYIYNDNEIKKYMEITKIDDKKITIKAINGYVGDNSFRIIAKVNGTNGTYKGEANISITIPLEMIRFSNANVKNAGLSIYTNPGNPYTTTINMEDFYELNQTDIIRYKVKYNPLNCTESTDVIWEILNTNGVLIACDETGAYKMNKPGKTSIKITSVEHPEITAQLDITVTSNTMPTYQKGDVNGDNKVTLIDYGLVLAHVKRTKLLTEEEFERADVSVDGKVTLIDYGLILAHVKRTKLLF